MTFLEAVGIWAIVAFLASLAAISALHHDEFFGTGDKDMKE